MDLFKELGEALDPKQAAADLKSDRNKCDRCGNTEDNLFLPGHYICDKCQNSWQLNPQTN